VKLVAAAGILTFVGGFLIGSPVVVGAGAAVFAFVALLRWREG
jgi:hypothetical protein